MIDLSSHYGFSFDYHSWLVYTYFILYLLNILAFEDFLGYFHLALVYACLFVIGFLSFNGF